MSTLAELFPAGGGKQANFTASGAIDAGAPVTLNADGTISEISSSSSSADLPLGSTATMVSNGTNVKLAAAHADPFNHNRWAFVWLEDILDGTDTIYVKFITRSSNSLTVSPARTVMAAGGNNDNRPGANACWCTHVANKLLIGNDGENANSTRGQAVVVTVSGSAGSETISVGTPHKFSAYQFAGDSQNWKSPFVPIGTTGNYLAGAAVNSKLYATILTVTGTTITSDSNDTELSEGSITSGNMADIAVNPFNPTEGATVYTGTSYQFRMSHFTISGTTLTKGTERSPLSIPDNKLHQRPTIKYVADGKAVVITKDQEVTSSRDHWYAFVATISSSSISAGTHVSWTPSHPASVRAEYQASISNSPNTPTVFVATWIGGGTHYPFCRVGTVNTSNNTVSFGTDTQMDSSNTSQTNQAILAVSQSHGEGGYFLVSWHDDNDVWVRLGKTGGSFSNFEDIMTGAGGHIGIADSAISDGASGSVTVKGGIYTSLSSLTIGADYYLQENGTIGTTSTSFKLGRALSATTIDLEYQS